MNNSTDKLKINIALTNVFSCLVAMVIRNYAIIPVAYLIYPHINQKRSLVSNKSLKVLHTVYGNLRSLRTKADKKSKKHDQLTYNTGLRTF